MPAAETSYCEVGDLLKGDIPLPVYMGDGSRYVDLAAGEIDAALGHLYVTPIRIDSLVAKNRPAILRLQQINILIGSGRLILDLAVASEDSDLHAYGRHMLKEGLGMLAQVAKREVLLTGAPLIPEEDSEKSFSGPVIFNEDSESLVGAYYRQYGIGSPQQTIDLSQGRLQPWRGLQ